MSVSFHHLSSWWYNDNNERKYDATLAVRKRGFTETWGRNHNDDTDAVMDYPQWFRREEESIGYALAQPYPKASVTLFQYNIGWKEIWALQMANIDFTIVNSTWSHMEATGALPAWKDDTKLMGCHQSSIWQYLSEKIGISTDEGLTALQRRDCVLWKKQLEELHHLCAVLEYRYEWESVYKKEAYCVATAGKMDSFFRATMAAYHVGSQRRIGLGRLPPSKRKMTVTEVRSSIESILNLFEETLGETGCILGTTTSTSVDIELWDLLMKAARQPEAPVRKIVMGSERLLKFMRDRFSKLMSQLNTWNLQQVESNVFFRNGDIWGVAKNVNASLNRMPSDPYETWNRWRMGGTFEKDLEETNESPRRGEEKAKLDNYRRQDEIWVSTVAALSAAAFFSAQLMRVPSTE